MGTRSSQSPKMPILHAGKSMLMPHQSHMNDISSSTDTSNSHSSATQDQYQYPAQADLLRQMPQNLESTGLLDDYRDQGHPYFQSHLPSSPSANGGMASLPDGHMDLVKYRNRAMNGFQALPDYDMQAPPQSHLNSEDNLDQQALRAKRDAETKRKQIPPFVQKLSRYETIVPIWEMKLTFIAF